MSLLGPDGNPITVSKYKKDSPPKTGHAYGDWAGRDYSYTSLPGGSILGFDLSRLTLNDFRQMRSNPQINASLSILSFMIHQIDWWIDCEDKTIKDMIETNLREKWSQLVRGIGQAYWSGYAPCALEYENNSQTKYIEISRIKDLVPEESCVRWKEVPGYAPPGRVRPKFKIYDGIKHGAFNAAQEIPSKNTFWYPLLMENGRYTGKKLLASAFTPWYFSTLVHLFTNRYYERFGEPTPIGRAPLDTEFDAGNGVVIPAREAMENMLSSLRSRGVVVLPSDKMPDAKDYEWDIEYLESQMRGPDFERYMSRLDEEMSLAIFTPILLFKTGDTGSNNLGVQHAQTFLWMLNALAADLKEYIDAYLVERLKGFNFGEDAPKAQWNWKPMGKENAETIRTMVSEMIKGGTVKPNIEELGKAAGMTLEEIEVVSEDDAEGEGDGRTGRSRPEQRRSQPRGVDEPRATGRSISARVSQQVEKAWKSGEFGNGFQPDFGYHRRMVEAFRAEGFKDPEQATEKFYGVITSLSSDALSAGRSSYSGPTDFMSLFGRHVDLALTQVENEE